MATRKANPTPKSTAAPKSRFTKPVTGLLPIRKLEIGESVEVKVLKIKRAKLGDLIHCEDLTTGEIYALSGHANLLNTLEVGVEYLIERAEDQVNDNTGRTFFSYNVFEADT